MEKKQKYIFVTGGVLSGVGKGITAASIGAILQAKGSKVSVQKCDPYLNVDAGLLSPAEHGECFVTYDGAETDLDLGHYERFLDIETSRKSTTLSGKLLQKLISDERAGKYGGKTVQLAPHLTGLIQDTIQDAANGSDVHIVEIGGTVGDYESLSFIEAIREFATRVGRKNCLYIHAVYVPFLQTSKEFKTKPAQNALKDLRGFGVIPDVIAVRTEGPAPQSVADKIAVFSGVDKNAVVLLPNISSVYEVPLNMLKSDILEIINDFTDNRNPADMSKWKELLKKQQATFKKKLSVGLVAKYMDNEDTYLSVTEALRAAAWNQNIDLTIKWINAEKATEKDFESVDALVVPGGFGARGFEGKVSAATYALEHNKPYLGLCLGLQSAVVAAARRGGLKNANSSEIDPKTTDPVIYIMNGQEGKESTGGTLRLGDYEAKLKEGSKIAKIYGSSSVVERHRHRYEVNQEYLDAIEAGGLIVSGTSPDGSLVEFVEAEKHPYFIATQAHPEFKSRPFRPHPLFIGLMKAVQ